MKIKYMAILLILLCFLIGAASAADDGTIDSLDAAQDDAVSIDAVEEADEVASTEPTSTQTDEKLEQSNDEILKTGTKTVDVNNFTELTDAINGAVNDSENDNYIINLNNGEYKTTTSVIFATTSTIAKNIMIKGNNQTIEALVITFNNVGSNIVMKDVTFNSQLRVYTSDMTLENVVLTKNSEVDQKANLTLNNSTLNAQLIIAEGKLVISDDCIFGGNAVIVLQNEEKSQMVISDINKVLPYLKNYYGESVIENAQFSFGGKRNDGKMTIKNSTIISTNGGQFANYGELIIIDSTVTAPLYNVNKITFINTTVNCGMYNYMRNNKKGLLNFTDDVIFGEKCVINGAGNVEIICNDINKILPFVDTYSGNYILSNITITKKKTNNGNLTLTDTIVNAYITNNGILTIGNNVTFGPNAEIGGTGRVISENISNVLPYMSTFYGDAVVSVNQLNKNLQNYGTLTFVNSTISKSITNYGTLAIADSDLLTRLSNSQGTLILKNVTITNTIINNANCQLNNCTLDATINNNVGAKLTISDDTSFGTKTEIYGTGEVIINDPQRVVDYVTQYFGNMVLTGKTISAARTNIGTLTLNNCIIEKAIINKGKLIIDDNTNFTSSGNIKGEGEIVTNNITRILPYIQSVYGNYQISDVTINKANYIFHGVVTLTNCTITKKFKTNYGLLYLNNCTINLGENEIFISNVGTIFINQDTKIIGKIENMGGVVVNENEPRTYTVTNDTYSYFFDSNGLTAIVRPGDTLDFQGTISKKSSLIINKPINIISSTNNGKIENFTSITFTKDASGSNVTGLYTYNTQVYVKNANHIIFDHITNVVEDIEIGSGVGVVSIRDNSSDITVKNSYFYTKDDGGHSTLVLAWANNCIIENNTIEGDGFIGNMLYLTTYNVENMPTDIVYNAHNKLINNRIRGPDTSMSICWGIVISGFDNLIDNNTINYIGDGIMFQWGSGVDGIEQSECLFGSGENVVSNNKLYGGCGIRAGDIIYNNYMEGRLYASNAIAYNNTANNLGIGGSSKVTNNTILNGVVFDDSALKSVLANNSIGGNISISAQATNNTLSNNDINGTITLDGSYNNLSNNKIITTGDYAVSSNKLGQNNNLTGNYLVANGKVGNDAVSLRDPSNVIASAGVATKVEVSVPGEVTVNKTVQVTVKLTDANGNPLDGQVIVSSALGSETVNVTKGTGVYQYTPKAIGEDTISVKFTGNDTFYLSSNSSNVKVVTEQQKTPVKPAAKTVVSLSFVKAPKKVSKKAKKLILSAKLKVNGKLVAGKKLTFKFKGKTFKVKTNKKGVAKLTIKSKVLKKLLKKVKAGKKVKYQVSYGKKTIKKTLKVKK